MHATLQTIVMGKGRERGAGFGGGVVVMRVTLQTIVMGKGRERGAGFGGGVVVMRAVLQTIVMRKGRDRGAVMVGQACNAFEVVGIVMGSGRERGVGSGVGRGKIVMCSGSSAL